MSYLRAKGDEEIQQAKENRKRKCHEQKAKKKQKRLAEYEDLHVSNQLPNDRCLYVKLIKDSDIVYDCNACKRLVHAFAFNSHVAMEAHKTALTESGFTEDEEFVQQELEITKLAERNKAKSVFCEPCQKWIPELNLPSHEIGKSHIHKAGPPEAQPVRVSRINNDSEQLFCFGTDMWKPGFTYTDVAICTLDGYQSAFFGQDTTDYGSVANPSMHLTIVKDPTAATLGVMYTVPKTELRVLQDSPKHAANKLEPIVVRVDDGYADAKVFVMKNVVKCKISTVSQKLAKAVGSLGPGYSMLSRLVHEHEKQDWEDEYLRTILKQTEAIIWGRKK
eukprot:TRINITY_DN8374_c1_g1_i2.p1 TRINITY_DN8374_c1_g1~~TRINITY_DN8374_c1_g1_i2.p1  ORF type:complete len:334 (+),score=57.56 TRINITY_DN8374_c1_g1_i2:228-1229(+)